MASATTKDVPKFKGPGEGKFIVAVSQSSGLDPRVVASWVSQEGAYADNGTKGFNYLNVKPTASGTSYSGVPITVSSGGFEQFRTVEDAIKETADRLSQPFAKKIIAAGADPNATPKTEIAAIADTGWDAAHYGGSGGPNLANKFLSQWGTAALDNPSLPPGKITISPDFTGQGASVVPADQAAQAKPYTPGSGDGPASALSAFGQSFFGSTGKRILEVVGGAALLLLGVKLLASAGVSPARVIA